MVFLEHHRDWFIPLLSGVSQEIATYDGIEALLKFVEAHGGSRIYMPTTDRGNLRLSREVTDRLICFYTIGLRLDVPSSFPILVRIRELCVVLFLKQGETVRKTAGYFGATERTIYNIKKKYALVAFKPSSTPLSPKVAP